MLVHITLVEPRNFRPVVLPTHLREEEPPYPPFFTDSSEEGVSFGVRSVHFSWVQSWSCGGYAEDAVVFGDHCYVMLAHDKEEWRDC